MFDTAELGQSISKSDFKKRETELRARLLKLQYQALDLEKGRLIATDAINAPRDFVQSRQLIAARAAIDTARLADVEVALKDLSV